MKALVLSFLIALSASNAFAEIAGYTKVAEDRLDDYRKAIRAGIAQNPAASQYCQGQWIQETLEYLNEIYISKTNSQPLILVNAYYLLDNQLLHRLAITSTPDLKGISQIEAQIYERGEVNNGDLANPVIVEDYILRKSWNCAKPPY